MNDLITLPDNGLTPRNPALYAAGQAANLAAAGGVFADYQERKAKNTLRRQAADLDLFADFLRSAGADAGELGRSAEAWRGVTWGLVAAFMRWQLKNGYAVSSANVRLSTIKAYARLALKAGTLETGEYAMIRAVEGYAHKEQKRIDDGREDAGLETRKGAKKAEAVSITKPQAKALKTQPDTPQGRRDALIMALFLDHGLRVGEVARLTVDTLDLKAGELRFYRPKVDKVQTHKLTTDTLRAAAAYLVKDGPALGKLLRGSRKGGKLAGFMSDRAITDRVRALGEQVGLQRLSAHDCRHYWATQAARNGTQVDRLQDAGGWASPAMPLRYVEAAKIANEGVNL